MGFPGDNGPVRSYPLPVRLGPPAHSEAERVERGVVLAFAALRLGLVVQLVMAGGFQVVSDAVPRPLLGLTALAIGWSIVYVVTAVRRGDLRSRAWGAVDLGLAVVFLVVMSRALPPALHLGSWLHWAPGYLQQVAAFVPAWLGRRRAIEVGVGAGLLYLACTLPTAVNPGGVIVDSLSAPLFTLAAVLFAGFTRRLARESDANARLADAHHRQAVDAAAALKLARYSFHVHNATGLLEAFARTDLDPAMIPSLQRQAAQEANRLRFEVLRGDRPADAEDVAGPVSLESVVWDATSGFGHLPLELSLALGRSARLAPAHAKALKAALIALLYNVQLHAHAHSVTVHADERDGRWEVTVADDGVGFEPDPARYRFGLREQVLGSMAGLGLDVQITSHPGEGACIRLSGPTA